MYYFLRMPFGCVNAPAVLQSTLEECVHEPTRLPTGIYFDDIVPHGRT